MTRVCYFTTKPSNDIRVFHKECSSLVKAGFQVYMVTPNAPSEVLNGVNIIGIDYYSRIPLSRFFLLPKLLYKAALKINAEIYHFNDPACLPYGLKLKSKNKKVIFDSFEDHPLLLLENKKLPHFIMLAISWIYSKYEFYACKKFDALICCYHWTQERLMSACNLNEIIFNFPIIKDQNNQDQTPPPVYFKNDFTLCYAGLISNIWNIDKIFSSLQKLSEVKFNIAGHGDHSIIERHLLKGMNNSVTFFGTLRPEEVHNSVYSCSDVGIALLDYLPLCKFTIGNMSNNKLFEYLKFGLPVICTDFFYWKEVVEKNNCGICVNPNNLEEIINAINYLKDNPEIVKIMGQNGKNVVAEKYNWSIEEKKLLNIYSILSKS
jgi:glycosyltransferase involved in cell wall biosynthesis